MFPVQYYVDRAPSPYRKRSLKEAKYSDNVFFYPACDFDWYPIVVFSYLCKRFIYVDSHRTSQEFTRALESPRCILRKIAAAKIQRCQAITRQDMGFTDRGIPEGFLDPEEVDACQYHSDNAAHQAWGYAVDMELSIRDETHIVHLDYICEEGVNAFFKLFYNKRKSPRFICIKGSGENYTNYNDFTQALGRAVRQNARVRHKKPSCIIAETNHNWPWYGVVEPSVPYHLFPPLNLYWLRSHPYAPQTLRCDLRKEMNAKESNAGQPQPPPPEV